MHAVEPVLQIAVISADVNLAEAVLHHARRPQQDLAERSVLSLGDVFDGGAAEIVARRPEARLDGAAFAVEALGDDVERHHRLVRLRRFWRHLCQGLARCRHDGSNRPESSTQSTHWFPFAKPNRLRFAITSNVIV